MAFDPDAILGITPSKGGFDPDAALGLKKPEIGGFTAAAKQVVGSTIKGVGQVGADSLPGVAQDNALTRYGQEVVDANLTRVQGFQDIIDQPWTTIKEAVGNAAPSVGGALGLRAAGQGITALAPFAGLAAPVVAGLGQAVSWGGPIIAAGLPSYGGIREEQLKTGNDGAVDKALALGGSAAVGAIEMAGGPQARALKALTGGLKREAGESIYKAVGKEALKSGLEEGAEELLQNPIEQAASYKNPLTTENLKETAFGGAMGFIGGGVLGGGMQLAGGQKEVPPVPPAIEEVQRQALAKATGGEVEIIDGVATITSGDNTITAPVESLTRHFTEGKTLDTFDTAAATASKLNEVRTAVQDENDPFTFDTLVAMSKDPEALKQAGLNRRDVEALVEAEIERGEIPEAAWIKQERAARQTNLVNLERLRGLDARIKAEQQQQEADNLVRQYQEGVEAPGSPTAVNELQTPLSVTGETQTAITRLTELEQKAQGMPGVVTPTSLSPQEEQEYVALRTQVSPADAQRMQEYQANVARRDALALKQSGAQAFETVGEGGVATVVPERAGQTLTPREQVELAQLVEVTRQPPVSPYVDDSRTLSAGLPAAQSETLFSQRPPWETGPVQDKATVTAAAQQVSPNVKYDGAMLDLHNFTITLPDGRQPSFTVKGEVTPQTVHAALNAVEERFGVPLTPAPETNLLSQGGQDGQVQGRRQTQVIEGASQPLNSPALQTKLDTIFGKGTAQRLIRQGKLQIVAKATDVPGIGNLTAEQERKAQGVYRSAEGKIYLVAGNLSKSTVTGVFKHEVVHALLRQDATFMARREVLLKDFAKLVGKDASVDAAAAKVPAGTQESVRVEESLAYWVQDEANHKHSLFRRIVAAVKAALKRLGIPTTSMTPADFSRLFAQGTEAFVNEGAQAEETTTQDSDTLFSQASTAHQQARQSLTTSLKEMAKDKLTEASPFLLRISPLRTLVQTLGNKIPQINKISEAFDEMNHVNTAMVEDAKGNYDAHKELNKKATGNNDKFNTAATLSTFYRMTPWKNLDEQEWVPTTGTREERLMTAEKKWKAAGMDKSTGKTFIAAWTEASKAYREVGSKEAQDQYRKMARHMRHIRQREETNVLATIESATIGNPKLRAEMMERFNATFKNIAGTYWPLTRDGEYILQYKDADGLPVVEHFQSAKARSQARQVLEQGGATEIQQGYASKTPRGQVAIPGELMQQFSQAIIAEKTKGLDPEQDAAAYQSAAKGAQDTINDLNQIWLRWQPETAALKNAIQRRNIKGYDLNAGRAYLEYVQRHAQSIAWTEQGKVIEGHLKDLQDKVKEDRKAGKNVDLPQMVLNDLRERVQAARDSHVGPIASFVGKLGTAMYMTSPSIALVQMTQLPMLTLPKLGVMYNSPGRAAKALMSGVRQAFSKKFNREAMFEDDKVNALFDMTRFVVTEENKNEPGAAGKALGQRVHDDAKIAELFGRLSKDQQKLFILRESLARNLLDISATHEAYAIAQGKDPDSAWRKVFDLAMAPMRISEQASRKAAILATMEMAQAQGKDVNKIMSDVSEVVNDTLYSYDKTNKPTFLQGSTGRVLAMFQWYRIMTMFRMALLFKRSIAAETPEIQAASRKEFIGIMGMAGVLAGTLGMPMAGLIFAALDAASDDDEPRDSALEWRNFLQEQFGERLGNIASYGLPAAVGMHMTKRTGMGDMFGMQSQPPPNLYGKDLAAWWAANQLGPAFSIGQGFVQGYDEMFNKGNVMGGMEAVLPKPLKDMMKAYRLWDEGELKSAGGKRILGPDQITPDMIPLIALGFNPLEAAKANEANFSRSKLGAQMSRRRGLVMNDVAEALQGDGDIDAAYESLADFNRKNPAFTIRGGELRTAIIRNIKTGLGVPSKRERVLSTVYDIPAAGQ